MKTVVSEIASLLEAMANCERADNVEWFKRHRDRLLELVKNTAPSGSGIDNGTSIDLDASQPNKLVFHTAFHHMDEYGGYQGWSQHSVVVKPDLAHRYTVTVTGKNWNDIKDYLAEVYSAWLNEEVSR